MTKVQPTDADRHRHQQRSTWDGVSTSWHRWSPVFELGARPVTDAMLTTAGVAGGCRVLDIGPGVGEPAMSAADLVGADGYVLGLDISSAMTELASGAATGRSNIDFLVGAIETTRLEPGSFDVALSRWSIVFAADRDVALRATNECLTEGGRFAAAAWGPPAEVPLISLGFRLISEYLELPPPPPGPSPFSWSDLDQATTELTAAGFDQAEAATDVVTFRFSDIDQFTTFTRDVLPPGLKRTVVERLGDLDDPELWRAFRSEAIGYRGDDGIVELPCTFHLVTGTA